MATVSVIIPLYNKVDYIDETLASLVAQERHPDEVIIVDDCSTDGSLETAKLFILKYFKTMPETRVHFIELDENKGPGFARNEGLKFASGDYVIFLDADDVYEPPLLEKAVRVVEMYRWDILAIGIELVPSGKTYPEFERVSPYFVPCTEDVFLGLDPLLIATTEGFNMGRGSNVLVAREYAVKESFSETARLNEGIDYWYRVLKHIVARNGKMGLLLGGHLKFREVAGSLSRSYYKNLTDVSYPPSFERYYDSEDMYDQFLFDMVSRRWTAHTVRHLKSPLHKAYFMLRHLPLYRRQYQTGKLRKRSHKQYII